MASDELEAQIDAARRLVASATGIVVLSGAGLSADSGLRTFRDPDGHWKKHRPEDLATPESFRRDPCLVWGWYGARRRAAADAEPNAAHRAIARLAVRRDDVTVVTQNVDSLHLRAAEEVVSVGGDTRVLELHGNLFRVRCTACDYRSPHGDEIDASSVDTLPHCPLCGALLRPDIVWFGEPLGSEIEEAFRLAATAQLCLVVGTSAVVHPAASVAGVTHQAGGAIVEVNPGTTPLTGASAVSLRHGAVEVLPRVLDNG